MKHWHCKLFYVSVVPKYISIRFEVPNVSSMSMKFWLKSERGTHSKCSVFCQKKKKAEDSGILGCAALPLGE